MFTTPEEVLGSCDATLVHGCIPHISLSKLLTKIFIMYTPKFHSQLQEEAE